jgi:hypothetical protein
MLTGLCILRRNRIFCNELEEISWRFGFWRRLRLEVPERVK